MPAVRPHSLAFVHAVAALTLVGAMASLLALFTPFPIRAAQHAVQIADSSFLPATLSIAVGDTVTWTNADDRPHTVTSGSGAFESGNIDEGGSFSFTFTEPGTYGYLCNYHPDMQASIVVQDTSAPAPAPAAGGSTSDGSDAPATGGGTAAPASHAPATHGAAQPDTALQSPVSPAWMSPLMIGLGLVALAFGVIPPARAVARIEARSPGWRR